MASNLKIWFLAARPKTLSAGISPVILGGSLAFRDHIFDLFPFLAALIGAILLQIGTNFANDYYDFKKGTDRPDRKGPGRATSEGWIQPEDMKKAFVRTFSLAALVSFYLVYHAGWVILIIAFFAIVSGLLYTAGPKPLGYSGWGDIFVFVFFGPVAVSGTYYVQSLSFSWESILIGCVPGFLSVAILAVNNLRDVHEDQISEKKTLTVRWGTRFTQWEYTTAVMLSLLVAVFHMAASQDLIRTVTIGLFFLMLLIPIGSVWRHPANPVLNRTLAQTGAIQFVVCVVYSGLIAF